jgi:Arc/MetJ-type ribon-helix-helix transcriptional regulator
MPQIAIRLSEDELAGLDRLVAERHFASRAAAIRDALAQVQKGEEDRQIAEEYRRAYADRPPTQDEIEWGHIGAYMLGKLTENEPPWEPGDGEEEVAPTPDVRFALQEIEIVANRLLGLVHTVVEQQRQAV